MSITMTDFHLLRPREALNVGARFSGETRPAAYDVVAAKYGDRAVKSLPTSAEEK